MNQTESEICTCKHYHEEDGTCAWLEDSTGVMGYYEDFVIIEEAELCNHVECFHSCYITAEDMQQPDGFDGFDGFGGFDGMLLDRFGNVNWRLAFSMP